MSFFSDLADKAKKAAERAAKAAEQAVRDAERAAEKAARDAEQAAEKDAEQAEFESDPKISGLGGRLAILRQNIEPVKGRVAALNKSVDLVSADDLPKILLLTSLACIKLLPFATELRGEFDGRILNDGDSRATLGLDGANIAGTLIDVLYQKAQITAIAFDEASKSAAQADSILTSWDSMLRELQDVTLQGLRDDFTSFTIDVWAAIAKTEQNISLWQNEITNSEKQATEYEKQRREIAQDRREAVNNHRNWGLLDKLNITHFDDQLHANSEAMTKIRQLIDQQRGFMLSAQDKLENTHAIQAAEIAISDQIPALEHDLAITHAEISTSSKQVTDTKTLLEACHFKTLEFKGLMENLEIGRPKKQYLASVILDILILGLSIPGLNIESISNVVMNDLKDYDDAKGSVKVQLRDKVAELNHKLRLSHGRSTKAARDTETASRLVRRIQITRP